MWPFDVVLDGVNYLIALLSAIPTLAIYGVQSFFYAVLNPVISSVNLLINMINIPIAVGNTVVSVFTHVTVDVLPQQAISYVLLAQLGIVILFRVYHFAKGISFLGFSI